jgi:hypothetical protein
MLYTQRVNWGQKRERPRKSVTHNKKWCPNSCGKRVEGENRRIAAGQMKMVYVCTVCKKEFAKAQMLEWYGKPSDGKL